MRFGKEDGDFLRLFLSPESLALDLGAGALGFSDREGRSDLDLGRTEVGVSTGLVAWKVVFPATFSRDVWTCSRRTSGISVEGIDWLVTTGEAGKGTPLTWSSPACMGEELRSSSLRSSDVSPTLCAMVRRTSVAISGGARAVAADPGNSRSRDWGAKIQGWPRALRPKPPTHCLRSSRLRLLSSSEV